MSTTPASPAYPGTPDEPTFGQLVAAASRDLSALVRDEIELAKSEIKDDVKNGAVGAGMFGAAGFLGVLVIILVSIAAAYGLVAAGLHPAWAFLIVAGVYLLIAGVLVLIGLRKVKKVGAPARTIRTSKDTAAFLKSPRSDGSSSTT